MTDKQLSRLRRAELLEILLEQGREQERLQQELDAARQTVAQRELSIQESGSIADAAFRLNDVMGAAQRAADLYTENVKRNMDRQQQEADKALNDAQTYAAQISADADKRVHAALAAANEQAGRILANARAEADRITAEAETAARRTLTDAGIQRDAILSGAWEQAGLTPPAQDQKKRFGLFGRRNDHTKKDRQA